MMTRYARPGVLCGALILGTLSASPALAQQERGIYVDKTVNPTDKRPQGLDTTLSVGATLNFVDNRDVVGQQEGSTWTLGANVKGALNYLRGNHDFRSSLVINETFARTPVIPEFVNTADELRLTATYYYTIPKVEWLGPFARAEALTSIFPGYAVFPEDKTFRATLQNGEVETKTNEDRFRLRESFRPLQLRQSIGGFVRPFSKKYLEVEARLGVGLREVFADNQFVLKDNADTPEIELEELRDYVQAGGELAVSAKGELVEKRVTYEASFEALMPFYNSVGTDSRSAWELLNYDATTKISFKLVSWASLDYQIRVIQQPLLVDKVQVQNNLLLTFGYTLIEKKPEAKPSEPAKPAAPAADAKPAAAPAKAEDAKADESK